MCSTIVLKGKKEALFKKKKLMWRILCRGENLQFSAFGSRKGCDGHSSWGSYMCMSVHACPCVQACVRTSMIHPSIHPSIHVCVCDSFFLREERLGEIETNTEKKKSEAWTNQMVESDRMMMMESENNKKNTYIHTYIHAHDTWLGLENRLVVPPLVPIPRTPTSGLYGRQWILHNPSKKKKKVKHSSKKKPQTLNNLSKKK